MEMTKEQLTEQLARLENQNGDTTTVKDNRYRLEVDAKQLQAWELVTLESGVIGDWLILFSRYLVNGDGLVSPELTRKPVDEMSNKEIKATKKSKAYKIVKSFDIPTLKKTAEAFSAELAAGF